MSFLLPSLPSLPPPCLPELDSDGWSHSRVGRPMVLSLRVNQKALYPFLPMAHLCTNILACFSPRRAEIRCLPPGRRLHTQTFTLIPQCQLNASQKVTVLVCPCPAAFSPGAGLTLEQRASIIHSHNQKTSRQQEEEEEEGGEAEENDLNKIPLGGFETRVVRVIGDRREEVSVRIFWRANCLTVISVTLDEVH